MAKHKSMIVKPVVEVKPAPIAEPAPVVEVQAEPVIDPVAAPVVAPPIEEPLVVTYTCDGVSYYKCARCTFDSVGDKARALEHYRIVHIEQAR